MLLKLGIRFLYLAYGKQWTQKKNNWQMKQTKETSNHLF